MNTKIGLDKQAYFILYDQSNLILIENNNQMQSKP